MRPAVLPLIEWNTDWNAFWSREYFPRVSSLSYSAIKKTSAPKTVKKTLAVMTILVSNANLENRCCLKTSTRTVQLIAPRVMRTAMNTKRGVLEKNADRLSELGSIVKPALLKADTERKADCQSRFSSRESVLEPPPDHRGSQ